MIFCFRQKQDISKYRLSGHNILINDRSRILFFFMKNLVKKTLKSIVHIAQKQHYIKAVNVKKKIRGKEKVHKNLYVKVDKSTQKKTDIRSIAKALELMSTFLLSGFTQLPLSSRSYQSFYLRKICTSSMILLL